MKRSTLILSILPIVIIVSAVIMAQAGNEYFASATGLSIILVAVAIVAIWLLLYLNSLKSAKHSTTPDLSRTITYCPKCGRAKLSAQCPACNRTREEDDDLTETKELTEKDLTIYDVWESPNGNLFLKVSDDYSLALGTKGDHAPTKEWGDLNRTQYVSSSIRIPVKRVGRIKFDEQ